MKQPPPPRGWSQKNRSTGELFDDDVSRQILLRKVDGVDCVYEDSPNDGPIFTVRFVYVPMACCAPYVALFVEKENDAGFVSNTFNGDLDTLILFD